MQAHKQPVNQAGLAGLLEAKDSIDLSTLPNPIYQPVNRSHLHVRVKFDPWIQGIKVKHISFRYPLATRSKGRDHWPLANSGLPSFHKEM
jgi:hypothetical protein